MVRSAFFRLSIQAGCCHSREPTVWSQLIVWHLSEELKTNYISASLATRDGGIPRFFFMGDLRRPVGPPHCMVPIPAARKGSNKTRAQLASRLRDAARTQIRAD